MFIEYNYNHSHCTYIHTVVVGKKSVLNIYIIFILKRFVWYDNNRPVGSHQSIPCNEQDNALIHTHALKCGNINECTITFLL